MIALGSWPLRLTSERKAGGPERLWENSHWGLVARPSPEANASQAGIAEFPASGRLVGKPTIMSMAEATTCAGRLLDPTRSWLNDLKDSAPRHVWSGQLDYRPPHPLAPIRRRASNNTIAPIVALIVSPMMPELR